MIVMVIVMVVGVNDDVLVGKVVDGYIVGVMVFVDVNGNGVLDVGEVIVIIDMDGLFMLIGVFGDFVFFGGIDVFIGFVF